MLKKVVIWIAAVVLVLAVLAGAAVGLTVWGRNRQQQTYETYTALQSQLENAALTVTEGEKTVGTYSLAELGVMDAAAASAENCFDTVEKMTAEEFAALPIFEQWRFAEKETERAVTVDVDQLNLTEVLVDLMDMERIVSADAFVQWDSDGYTVVPEVYGTDLDYEIICSALEQTVSGWTVTPDQAEPRSLDVAACSAYMQPTVTAEEDFEFETLLAEATKDLVIPVKLLTETVEVPVQPLVSVDEDGKSTVDTDTLKALVEEWAANCPKDKTDFILDSYERGPVPLDFLKVTYELDQEALLKQLTDQVSRLDGTMIEAPYLCERNGEPYELGDTYVEVDIFRQKMAFFFEGELVTFTDVVTGLPWGYWTWPGLYGVQNKETDCQLTGPDYSVHVDYWVGYSGEYGIHDAEWRDVFGGKRYHTNGSHGCVNTPTEPMKKIFEKIEVGTPVIVHFVEDETLELEEA